MCWSRLKTKLPGKTQSQKYITPFIKWKYLGKLKVGASDSKAIRYIISEKVLSTWNITFLDMCVCAHIRFPFGCLQVKLSAVNIILSPIFAYENLSSVKIYE